MTAQRDQDSQPRTGQARLPERLFTAINLAVFLALLACVVIAAVLWELWH